jgi:hypothetical protein
VKRVAERDETFRVAIKWPEETCEYDITVSVLDGIEGLDSAALNRHLDRWPSIWRSVTPLVLKVRKGESPSFPVDVTS